MKHIRIKINDLLDRHSESFYTCNGCAICTEINELSKQLLRDPIVKFKHILEIGPDMRKSDIEFLLDNNIQQNEIYKALGISQDDFRELLINFGLRKTRKSRKLKEEQEMPKITFEEYQDLKAQGKTDKAIAIIKNIHPTLLPPLKREWGISKEQRIKEKKKHQRLFISQKKTMIRTLNMKD